MSRKTSLRNRLQMYDNLQQQINYLPDLFGQFGLPFKEDLKVASGITPKAAQDGPKPLEAGDSRQTEWPESAKEEPARYEQATTTSDLPRSVPSSPAAEPIPALPGSLPAAGSGDVDIIQLQIILQCGESCCDGVYDSDCYYNGADTDTAPLHDIVQSWP